jgi:hypothetical protein
MFETTSDGRVSWIEGFVPDTEEARIVYALITERGVRTQRALAHALAAELFERDRRLAGALAGIGLFRAWYASGADRLLDALDGGAIRIDRAT